MGLLPGALITLGASLAGRVAAVAGAVVMIVILVIAPVLICMGGVVVASLLGYVLKAERDDAFEGTEQLDLANRS